MKAFLLSGAALAGLMSGTVLAAEANDSKGGLEEIVVTAQKRTENVQNVPIAITAFTATALQERAVTSVASLSSISPNVTLDAGTPFSGSSSVLAAYIRGIGANDFAFNIDPGVGVYLDGVYLARSVGANQELPDVERVEILKGPQGTLFGRNTIGGAIAIVTHDPGKDFKVSGDVTTGSYNLIQTRATMDLPITESLRSSFSFATKNRNGFMHRLQYDDGHTYAFDPITAFKAAGYNGSGIGTEGGENSYNLRGKLKWDDGSNLKVTISGDYSYNKEEQIANKLITTFPFVFAGTYNCALNADEVCTGSGGPPAQAFIPNRAGISSILQNSSIWGVNTDNNPNNNRLPYDDRFVTDSLDTTYATGNNFTKLKSYGGAGVIDYALSDDMALKSITAYRELHWSSGMDLDGSPINFLNTSFYEDQWQFSQELQLTGKALDSKLNYALGAYYFKEAGGIHDYVTFAEGLLQVDGPNQLETKNYAFYGQLDYKPTEQLGITIGGRYTHEDKTFEGGQQDLNGLNYKLAAEGFGPPGCDTVVTTGVISDACRIANGFPNPGEPLRYYIAGVNSKKFSNFSPKIGLQYHATETVMLYASWSKGYKTGGWTTRLSNPLPTAADFGEEKATTWEAGVKSTLFDRHLQLNAAAFTTDYTGIQLNFQEGVSPTIRNAGTARIKGFEIEAVAKLAEGLTVNASAGYTDAYYTQIDLAAQVAASPLQGGVLVNGDLPKTPKLKFNISPRYEAKLPTGGSLIFIADYTHTSASWNDTERTYLLQKPAYSQVNASVMYKEPGGRWNLTVGGTNLTNDRYFVTGQAQLAGGQIYGTPNRPSEWYAKLGFNF